MLEINDVQESFERRIKQLEEELANTPKECNGFRNNILMAISELHKLRADLLLGRDEDSCISYVDSVFGEQRMRELIKGDFKDE